MCAQGQALHFLDGMSAENLRELDQSVADKRIAELFGISRAHAVLLRMVNDRQDGAPAIVIRNPELVLGDQAYVVLAFWQHLDRMNGNEWAVVEDAVEYAAVSAAGYFASNAAEDAGGASARDVAGYAAASVARGAAMTAVRGPARYAAGYTAWATNEIQGAAAMRAKNQPFFFLPLFGFADPEAVMAAAQ
jgi:hypothetical protein